VNIRSKNRRFEPPIFLFFFLGGAKAIFMEYHNEQHRKDIFIEDLVKILPAVAVQSRQNGKKHRTATKI